MGQSLVDAAHVPRVQTSPLAHAASHAPQCATRIDVSTQTP
jgi:hypothetical protein